MSMPGFDYHLACGRCGIESERYPLLPFHQSVTGELCFAIVDRALGAFGTLHLYLSFEQRRGPGAVGPRDVAQRWSGPDRIVVVPQGLAGRLWPDPVPCPGCGAPLIARSPLFGAG